MSRVTERREWMDVDTYGMIEGKKGGIFYRSRK